MSFSEIFPRLCKEMNVDEIGSFAEKLRIKPQDVDKALDEDVIPYSWYSILWEKYKFAPEWVRTGQGEKTLLTNFQRSNNPFAEIYARLLEGTDVNSDMELADILKVRASSIRQFQRERYIPLGVYFQLYLLMGLNPVWVESGVGPMRLPLGAAV